MRIGFRKILRDLWRSKGRTLLAVLSIFIGVFAIGTISGLRDLLPGQMLEQLPHHESRTCLHHVQRQL